MKKLSLILATFFVLSCGGSDDPIPTNTSNCKSLSELTEIEREALATEILEEQQANLAGSVDLIATSISSVFTEYLKTNTTCKESGSITPAIEDRVVKYNGKDVTLKQKIEKLEYKGLPCSVITNPTSLINYINKSLSFEINAKITQTWVSDSGETLQSQTSEINNLVVTVNLPVTVNILNLASSDTSKVNLVATGSIISISKDQKNDITSNLNSINIVLYPNLTYNEYTNYQNLDIAKVITKAKLNGSAKYSVGGKRSNPEDASCIDIDLYGNLSASKPTGSDILTASLTNNLYPAPAPLEINLGELLDQSAKKAL
ncbi:MAG: hypothetical protein C4K58_07205 [Flavobacteriaceae bacterium]|nr:MAG: hypothetical protein C4K58_07205 [Flavobacteriaceae bacterium]